VLDRISEIIANDDDFYQERHQLIFAAMRNLAEGSHNVDLITITNELRRQDKLEGVGGVGYLDTLTTIVQSSAHAASYARIVADTATERRLQQAGHAISHLALDGELTPGNKVDRAEELVFAVADKKKSQQLEQIKPLLKATFDEMNERFQRKESVTGVSTGFRDLDALTSGFQKSNLIIVAARPAMGKTAFCLSIAQNVVLNQAKTGTVALFSLEMSQTELVQRVLCSVAGVNQMDVRKGNLGDQD
jgi:replicative DNA helicase